jgi:hypothetical protein
MTDTETHYVHKEIHKQSADEDRRSELNELLSALDMLCRKWIEEAIVIRRDSGKGKPSRVGMLVAAGLHDTYRKCAGDLRAIIDGR